MVEIAARAALDAGCFEAVLVVQGELPLDAFLPVGVVAVENPEWRTGQAGSLRRGVDVARALGADAVVVGLADQPGVGPEDWRSVSRFVTDLPVVVATYGGVRGNPVRLSEEVWEELPREGDEGARALMRRRPELVAAVACPGDASDVDTVEDLNRWN